MYELTILNNDVIYKPIIEGKVTWETIRQGVPGKLSFNVVKDDIINFQEGNAVGFKLNNRAVFYGFVFTKSRSNQNIISVTAYDQLRYLKNKTYYQYENKAASDILRELVERFGMMAGDIEDTAYKIPHKNEEGKTLFDIIQNALDETLQVAHKMYVLFDDFGKISLKNIASMQCDDIIDQTNAQSFTYKSSIDESTYNTIELIYADKAGQNKSISVKDEEHLKKWGVLQYYKKINNVADSDKKVATLLKLHNKKTRTLSIKDAMGNIGVRAGSLVPVHLDVGDIVVDNMMVAENVKHIFEKDNHTMNLSVRGGFV